MDSLAYLGIGSVIVSLVLGFVCNSIVKEKGYPDKINYGFLWGFFLNVIGLIVCACKVPYFIIENNGITPNPTSADKLMKYKELLDAGVITQEEYEKKMQELLKL